MSPFCRHTCRCPGGSVRLSGGASLNPASPRVLVLRPPQKAFLQLLDKTELISEKLDAVDTKPSTADLTAACKFTISAALGVDGKFAELGAVTLTFGNLFPASFSAIYHPPTCRAMHSPRLPCLLDVYRRPGMRQPPARRVRRNFI